LLWRRRISGKKTEVAKGSDDWNGISFLEHIARLEEGCSETFEARSDHLGKRAAQCYEALGMCLVLLDCTASCWWGCQGGDHRLEYLVGRAANSTYAAVFVDEARLLRQGRIRGARARGSRHE